MRLQPRSILTLQDVVIVAKQLLIRYAQSSLTLSPYRLARGNDGDGLLISTLDGRGIILIQKGNYIESNLKSSDFAWFAYKQKQLEASKRLIEQAGTSPQATHNKSSFKVNNQRNSGTIRQQAASVKQFVARRELIEDL